MGVFGIFTLANLYGCYIYSLTLLPCGCGNIDILVTILYIIYFSLANLCLLVSKQKHPSLSIKLPILVYNYNKGISE